MVQGRPIRNLWRDFRALCRRAGVTPWPKWCHTLRKNCESDWLANPNMTGANVAQWLGHDPKVAQEYYNHIPPGVWQEAAATDPFIGRWKDLGGSSAPVPAPTPQPTLPSGASN